MTMWHLCSAHRRLLLTVPSCEKVAALGHDFKSLLRLASLVASLSQPVASPMLHPGQCQCETVRACLHYHRTTG
jgi:hypothetical protein